ncbi:MAG: hypothetical protein U1E05_22560 [Patescibacteria group bacterium]|nr:hypothetical protein [Patescibacteria group bacterium]
MFGTKPWVTFLWPGFPQLWARGSWVALAVAAGASMILNVALLGSLVWRELLPGEVRSALWLAIGLVWAAGALYSFWFESEPLQQGYEGAEDPFPKAVVEYLKGNWYEAERMLTGLLRRDVRDVQARLLLTALLRRVGRLEEAGRQLDTLTRFEAADHWQLEIQRERQLIQRKQAGQSDKPDGLRSAA